MQPAFLTGQAAAPHSLACRHARVSRLPGHAARKPIRSRKVIKAASSSQDASPIERAVNFVTVRITQSPVNEGKKRFFRFLAGNYDSAAVQSKIQMLVNESPVTVFSWTFCPFAKKAKQLLTEVGADFKAVELDQLPDGKALKAELGMMYNRTSVPNVFIGGQSYGGLNDGPGILKLHEQGRLLDLLKQNGALR